MLKTKNTSAFTLIEILAVIAIIGILATLSIAGLNRARSASKVAKARHDSDIIFKAIQQLQIDTEEWPDNQEIDIVCSDLPGGCHVDNEICGVDINSNACVTTLSAGSSGIISTDGSYSDWQGPYRTEIPLDPWGREYFFDTDYSIDANDEPCGCGGGGCRDAVVIGSYGPDEQGKPDLDSPGAYGCDDIIKIIKQ
ncbi:type II secretion system protein [Candidatus Falkowbacteria bacterium]|nr:type II secretion system protein [Candidatus Falkowbacteria bacterium]